MKTETLLDIIFCVAVMPGMMFLFPTGEWILWHPGYVLMYVVWLYGVWFLCRRVLGPATLQGGRGLATTLGSLFLVAIVTFLMTLTTVDFPRDFSELGKMQLHVRAMWVLLLADVAYSLPVGILSSRLQELASARQQHSEDEKARLALETLRQEADAVAGEDLQVKSGYKTVHIPLSAIRFVEGRNNYACFHLDNREDVVSQITMKKVMELLPEGKFARIHRSYIVPLWRIRNRNGKTVQLMGVEEELPIGRAFKEELNSLS